MATETQGDVIVSGSKRVQPTRIKLQAQFEANLDAESNGPLPRGAPPEIRPRPRIRSLHETSNPLWPTFDPHLLGGLAQIGIQRGQRERVPHRQLQISRVVLRERMGASQGEGL